MAEVKFSWHHSIIYGHGKVPTLILQTKVHGHRHCFECNSRTDASNFIREELTLFGSVKPQITAFTCHPNLLLVSDLTILWAACSCDLRPVFKYIRILNSDVLIYRFRSMVNIFWRITELRICPGMNPGMTSGQGMRQRLSNEFVPIYEFVRLSGKLYIYYIHIYIYNSHLFMIWKQRRLTTNIYG